MKVSLDVLRQKTVEFVQNHLVPQMGSNSDRFLVSFAVGLKAPEIDTMARDFGLASGNEVDVDRIDAALRMAFKATTDGRYKFSHKLLENDLYFAVSDWEAFKGQLGG